MLCGFPHSLTRFMHRLQTGKAFRLFLGIFNRLRDFLTLPGKLSEPTLPDSLMPENRNESRKELILFRSALPLSHKWDREKCLPTVNFYLSEVQRSLCR